MIHGSFLPWQHTTLNEHAYVGTLQVLPKPCRANSHLTPYTEAIPEYMLRYLLYLDTHLRPS